jgi:hypothetical protein
MQDATAAALRFASPGEGAVAESSRVAAVIAASQPGFHP